MRYTFLVSVMNSSDANSSGYSSCETIYSSDETEDDDCLVVGSQPPPRGMVSPAVSNKTRCSSWSAWEVKSCAKRSRNRKTRNSFSAPDIVEDSQQNLRRQWEAATLRRRTCPPMRSEGSKVGINGWEPQPPQSAGLRRETDSSVTLGGDSGAAETVQSNANVSPARSFCFQNLSSSSSDSVVQVTEVEPSELENAEHGEVASASRKSAPPASAAKTPASAKKSDPVSATDDRGLHDSSSNSVFRNIEDPLISNMHAARDSGLMDGKKGSKRRIEREDDAHDARVKLSKIHGNGNDGASTSGQVAQDTTSLRPMDVDNQSSPDSGILEPVSDVVVGQDLVGEREKLKQTADFKLADEEEWANRQQELQKQALEARKLRERKRAETERNNEVELRQKQRLEEIRQTQQREERNMGMKDQLRGQVQANLERLASECRDMASLLRRLQIPVEGGKFPTQQQVNAAYKKALLRFHPDRTSAIAQGDPQRLVEAEETFKLITRMKPILKPSSMFNAMTAR
ncbi:uncharacterized protein [Physcomitrium patens]|uniref:J domain-containing protein n=1 Tax=Physcomitrium patens TaxID=3218 RepID=A0A2K1L6G1_PHYPA|nr:protein split ends-like [Physcomitrium patens]XP_024391163.1 protein split ends-like [Physcomitrium patens]PNR61618.1 hypothetical protein PHYPA_000041 [Physcomitrium patens]|eukprot:XP_024391154.1 protein split ends-like [Physcomitrella patens]